MRPDDTAPDGAVLIPLRARDGSIRAYAIIDGPDADFVNQWCWGMDGKGYARRSEDGKDVYLHRELLGLPRIRDGREGDHRDRNRLNNRRANLRPATHAQNLQNQPGHRGSSSTLRGVCWEQRKSRWRAGVTVNGKWRHLGYFLTEEEAAEAARSGRVRLLPYAVD